MMRKKCFVLIAFLAMTACGGEIQKKTTNTDNNTTTVANEKSEEKPGNKKGTALFAFEETTYQFGMINEGDRVTHTFRFTNEGDVPLIIQDAEGSCGCTVPEYSETPIQPGESGEIKVVFNSVGKRGNQNKTVTLYANTDPETTVLNIKGEVVAAKRNIKDKKGPLKD